MRIQKIIAMMMAMLLMFSNVTMTGYAAENAGVAVRISSETVKAGEQVTVTVSLTGYDADAVPIRGIQMDVTGVDESVLVVEDGSYVSLIEDATATRNTAVYQQAKKLLRLLYVRMEGTLASPYEDVFQMTFVINPELTEAGSITLPLEAMIVTTESNITLYDEITISYVPGTEEPDVVSVDVTWGAMEFVYTEGTWNTKTHSYEGAGWTDDGTGYVTVSNTGSVDTTAGFKYTTERTDISGSFDVTDAAELKAGAEITAHLTLFGKPESSLGVKAVIGTATVTIGGG